MIRVKDYTLHITFIYVYFIYIWESFCFLGLYTYATQGAVPRPHGHGAGDLYAGRETSPDTHGGVLQRATQRDHWYNHTFQSFVLVVFPI